MQVYELIITQRNIEYISEFIGMCKNMKKLNLSNNRLTKIDYLTKLGLLTDLDLSFNQISKIENLRCPNLRVLNLDSNKLFTLDGVDQLNKL